MRSSCWVLALARRDGTRVLLKRPDIVSPAWIFEEQTRHQLPDTWRDMSGPAATEAEKHNRSITYVVVSCLASPCHAADMESMTLGGLGSLLY